MDKLLTLLRLAADLHLGTSGDGIDELARARVWMASPDGEKVIGDLDQLLAELDLPIAIAVRKK